MGGGRPATRAQIRKGKNPARADKERTPEGKPSTTQLFRCMQKHMNELGGGEGTGGVFGTLRQSSSERVMASLKDKTGMGRSSTFLDIGAGLGHPLLHASLEAGVRRARGIENDPVKVMKAEAFLSRVFTDLRMKGALPTVVLEDIGKIKSIDDTHMFAFWEGINPKDRAVLGRLARADKMLKGVAVAGRAMRGDPSVYMAELGFPRMTLVDTLPVQLAGSGQGFTAYIFKVEI